MNDLDHPKPRQHRSRLILWIAVLAVLGAALLLSMTSSRKAGTADGKFHVLCTFLPVYVLTLNVVGDTPGVEVELLVDTSVGCPHTYEVRAADLKRVARADLIVANGLGAEPFLPRLVHDQPRGKIITISDDCEPLGAAPEEDEATTTTAHEAGHDHGREPENESEHDHAHGGVNPHAWVSPKQAVLQVRRLAGELAKADPAHADHYRANGEAFIERLEALHRRMQDAAVGFAHHNIVTFHDAFAYLARDLGLKVVATLTVVPGDTASAGQMAHVIQTIRNTGAAAVFYEPVYSDQIARTVARDAGVPVFPLNPFNTVDGTPTARSYEEVMNRNLQVLQQALSNAATRP